MLGAYVLQGSKYLFAGVGLKLGGQNVLDLLFGFHMGKGVGVGEASKGRTWYYFTLRFNSVNVVYVCASGLLPNLATKVISAGRCDHRYLGTLL